MTEADAAYKAFTEHVAGCATCSGGPLCPEGSRLLMAWGPLEEAVDLAMPRKKRRPKKERDRAW